MILLSIMKFNPYIREYVTHNLFYKPFIHPLKESVYFSYKDNYSYLV